MIESLKTMLKNAENGGYAVGAFNIFNYLTAKAVIDTCQSLRSPVILQLSVRTVRQLGLGQAVRALLNLTDAVDVPAIVHLDHCKDLDFAKACVDFGFHSVMIDGSAECFKKNIEITKTMKEYTKGKGCDIEGELGTITGTEEDIVVMDKDRKLADAASSKIFVEQTGVDVFAPAIGTAHGVYKGEPKIELDRFSEIKANVSTPLVVHGGTGLSREIIRNLIARGAAKINISTAIKIAYLDTIRNFLKDHPSVSEPLVLDAAISLAVSKTTKEHIELFGSAGKA